MIRRIINHFFVGTLVSIVLLPVILFFAFQIKPVQAFLNRRITDIIQETLNTKVTIGNITYVTPFDIIISNLYIEDYQQDTLINIQQLKVRPLYYSFKKKVAIIDRISIKGMRFEYRSDSTGFSNLDFFIANLPNSSDTTTSNDSGIKIKVNKISIEKSNILYVNNQPDTLPYGIDIDTLDFYRFNFKASNFVLSDEDIKIKIIDFTVNEKTGFKIRHFSSDAEYSSGNIILKTSSIALNYSKIIANKISFFPSDKGYGDINNLVLDLDLNRFTTFSTADLAYFSDVFKTYHEKVNLQLIAHGTLEDLSIENMILKYKNNTYISASGEIIGLPNIDSTFFDLHFDSLSTDNKEIFTLKDPETSEIYIDLPTSIKIPDFVNFTGEFTGFIENFYLKGDVHTSSGNIYTDADIINKENIKSITGTFELNKFDIGHLIDNEGLGIITMKDSIDLSITDSNIFSGYNFANIYEAEYNNYLYKNIVFNSSFSKDTVLGNIKINDTNIVANISIDADISNKIPYINYDIIIDFARPFYLNFSKNDTLSYISSHLGGYVSGSSVNDLKAKLQIIDTTRVIFNMTPAEFSNFSVLVDYSVDNNNDTLRKLTLNSEFIDGNIKGEHTLSDLSEFASNLVPYYFPALRSDDSLVDIFAIRPKSDLLTFYFRTKNLSKVLALSMSDIQIPENSSISGTINSNSENFNVNILSDSILISDNKISNINFNIFGDTSNIQSTIILDSIIVSNFNLDNFTISTITQKNQISIILSWDNNSKLANYGEIATNIKLKRDTTGGLSIIANIPENNIVINNVRWNIKADTILYDTTGIYVKNFRAVDSTIFKQIIGAHGKISHKKDDFLYFYINGFDLSQLNPIVQTVKLGGKLRSTAKLAYLLDTPYVSISNTIDDFAINDEKMGLFTQNLRYDKFKDTIITIASLTDKMMKEKIVNGKKVYIDTFYNAFSFVAGYNLFSQNFSLLINFDNLKIKPFKSFYDEYILFSKQSNLNGTLNITGDRLHQDVQGFLNFYGAFKLVPVGSRFTLNKGMRLSFKNDLITIEKTVITGPGLAGDASFGGTIKHNNFKTPYVDLNFRADTIELMNLPRTNESHYYGTFIASGDVDITGYLENLSITADIITEPKTNLTLLLDRQSEITNKTAIVTFKDPYDKTIIETDEPETATSNTNIDIDLNLKLNPEAKFKLVFNELTGEALEIQGDGDIKIKKTAMGDAILFGKIAIEKGMYNFVLENIINRKFVIQKGSSITFNGAPTDGILDITTIYTLKNVGLYSLLLDDNYLDTKTQADCYIKIGGTVEKPEIKFNVKLPKADRKIATQVQNLDEANINKQFLSLLLIGRFQPLPGLTFDPGANLATGTFNAGELVSNQLNALLSNLGSDVDLDVNYITGDKSTTDQFDVAVSVPIFNDKVSINTDVGVGGNNVNAQDQNNFIGDFEVDVKLNQKGNVMLKGFNKTNRNNYYESGYTQGVGLLYKTSLDNLFKKDTIR